MQSKSKLKKTSDGLADNMLPIDETEELVDLGSEEVVDLEIRSAAVASVVGKAKRKRDRKKVAGSVMTKGSKQRHKGRKSKNKPS